jgi:hypothetical protein
MGCVKGCRYAAVMHTRGWTSSHDELHRIKFLDWLYDNSRDGQAPSVGNFKGSPYAPGGIDNDALQAIIKACETAGLLRLHEVLAGVLASSATLTNLGTTEVRQRHERRDDLTQQSIACRDALVSWLYDRYLHGMESPDVPMFLNDPRGHFEGKRFDQRVVERATLFLRDKGIISGEGAWGGGVVRPKLTAAGIDCAEQYDSSVRDYLRAQHGGGAHFTTHFHGEVSGQVGVGANVTQTQHQGIDPGTLQRLLEDVREAAEQVDRDQAQYLLTYADTIQAEVTTESPDADVIRGSGNRLKQIAGKVGDAGLTASVAALVQFLTQALGGG